MIYFGREVARLVNEEPTSGSYEKEWNAATTASGIYLYRLTAGNYSSVQKMLLIIVICF